MADNDFASSRLFYDNKHFPKGFGRSGIFSRREAELLERHGYAMQELSSGRRPPVTEAETAFCEVLAGKRQAETEFERVWLKYCDNTSHRRLSYTTGMAFAMTDGTETGDIDFD